MAKIDYLEPTWRDWIVLNLQRSCTHDSIVEEMVAKDFEPAYARTVVTQLAAQPQAAVAGERPANDAARSPVTDGQAPRSDAPVWVPPWARDSSYVAEPSRIPSGNVIMAGGHAVQVVARLSRPDVVVLANVLTEAECALLIWLAREKLNRSTTVDPQTGELTVIANRTSFGGFFARKENELIERLDDRFAELLRWPVEHAEGLQVLRYQVGGEYKPHFDYFPVTNAGSAQHLAQGGQRIASLVIYLNEVQDGGETIFPELGLSVVPRPGYAVYFAYWNAQQQVDPLTLHGGSPVQRGEKWIATKWLRQYRRA